MASSGHAALDQIDRIDHLDAATLARLTRDYQDLPAAQLFAAATRLQNSQDRDELDARVNEVIMRQAPRIDRFLWVLDTIVTLAPLLGLLGTIIGMFNAFQVL